MLDYSREFIKLAIYENITVAARKMHLSPSTLSRHMADLEKALGFKLFHRSPMELTAAGQYYLESISSVIDTLDEIVLHGRAMSEEGQRPFCIYMLPARTKWSDAVYEAASRLRRQHPGVTTTVCLSDKYLTTEEALISGVADVGVVFEGSLETEQNLRVEELARAPICVWVNRENPLAECSRVSIKDVGRFAIPCSTNRQACTGTNAIEWILRENGIPPKTHFRNLEDRAAFYTSLKANEVLLDFAEDSDPLRFNGDLVRLELSPSYYAPIYIACRADDCRPLVEDFLEACHEAVS